MPCPEKYRNKIMVYVGGHYRYRKGRKEWVQPHYKWEPMPKGYGQPQAKRKILFYEGTGHPTKQWYREHGYTAPKIIKARKRPKIHRRR